MDKVSPVVPVSPVLYHRVQNFEGSPSPTWDGPSRYNRTALDTVTLQEPLYFPMRNFVYKRVGHVPIIRVSSAVIHSSVGRWDWNLAHVPDPDPSEDALICSKLCHQNS